MRTRPRKPSARSRSPAKRRSPSRPTSLTRAPSRRCSTKRRSTSEASTWWCTPQGRCSCHPSRRWISNELDGQHRTNLRGTFAVCQQAIKRLREGGAILTFTSSVVQGAFPTYAGYSASKGGVEAMTLIMARELGGRDVTVNAVGPGPVATPLFLNSKSQEEIDAAASRSPMGRLGTPEDIAGVVAFLAGAEGRWRHGRPRVTATSRSG